MPTNVRRVTADLPAQLLDEGMNVTGQGVTETLVAGLRRILAARVLERVTALRGTVGIDVDLETSRERLER